MKLLLALNRALERTSVSGSANYFTTSILVNQFNFCVP